MPATKILGGYTYTPAYYSSLHDSITSLCKNIIPLSLKKLKLPSAERKQSKEQSENLKWQQESFHQILNLMGLAKEGICTETEVAAYRAKLLENLIVSRRDSEQPVILRDKLLFLQELLYAKCISTDEYHSSKRPLLQRLAVQGVEIEARDVILGEPKEEKNSGEEWSVIDLRDEHSQLSKEKSKNKSRTGAVAIKHIKGAASSVLSGFGSYQKHGRNRQDKSIFEIAADNPPPPQINPSTCNEVNEKDGENPLSDNNQQEKDSEKNSILMTEILTPTPEKLGGKGAETLKKKAFLGLFKEKDGDGDGDGKKQKEVDSKSGKKQWGFEGIKKWARGPSNVNMQADHETTPLPVGGRSSEGDQLGVSTESSPSTYSVKAFAEGPDTKQIRKKLLSDGSPSDFFIDKVVGEKIKKELTRIQTELCCTNQNLHISNDQIEAVSTKLPVDKADLKRSFPKAWCDRYGDVVLDIVKKEFKEHVEEMENTRNATLARQASNIKRWTTFEDDENCHPNPFASQDYSHNKFHDFNTNNPFLQDQNQNLGNKYRVETAFEDDENYHPNLFAPQEYNHNKFHDFNSNNPFLQDQSENLGNKYRAETTFSQDQNPFWSPKS